MRSSKLMDKIKKYSINLMWINDAQDENSQFICKGKDSNYVSNFLLIPAIKWKKSNSQAEVNIWYDSRFTNSQAVENTKEQLELQTQDAGCGAINLLDIRSIDIVQRNPDVFSGNVDAYFRIDLMKLIICVDSMVSKGMDSAMFSDVSVGDAQCELLLMSDEIKNNPQAAQLNKLYLAEDGNYITRYGNTDARDNPTINRYYNSSIVQGSLLIGDFSNAKIDLSNLVQKIADSDFKQQVLDITYQRKHTRDPRPDGLRIIKEELYNERHMKYLEEIGMLLINDGRVGIGGVENQFIQAIKSPEIIISMKHAINSCLNYAVTALNLSKSENKWEKNVGNTSMQNIGHSVFQSTIYYIYIHLFASKEQDGIQIREDCIVDGGSQGTWLKYDAEKHNYIAFGNICTNNRVHVLGKNEIPIGVEHAIKLPFAGNINDILTIEEFLNEKSAAFRNRGRLDLSQSKWGSTHKGDLKKLSNDPPADNSDTYKCVSWVTPAESDLFFAQRNKPILP